ncbi:hypothetical protein HDU77_002548 [Chytriomyces hyalinus]|nr:hypothetical protein HDU77_002548 [Chytriomyces hyalinus]
MPSCALTKPTRNSRWSVRVSVGRDEATLCIDSVAVSLPEECAGADGCGDKDPDTRSYSTTRSYAEIDLLFDLVREKHPLFCFCVSAPLKHSTAIESVAATRYAQAFLTSVLAIPALANDTDHITVFFTSVFRYIPDPFPPAQLQSRRSAASSSAFSLVFLKRRDDVDRFFDQAKAHILAMQGGLLAVVKNLDTLAGTQIEYGTGLFQTETRLSEYASNEIDPIAGNLRKLANLFYSLESITHAQSHHHLSNTRPRMHSHTRSLNCMSVALDARLVALDEYEDSCKVTRRRTQQLGRVGGSAAVTPSLKSGQRISNGGVAGAGVWEDYHLQLSALHLQAAQFEVEATERLTYATSTIKESYGKVRDAQGDDLQQILNDYVANQIKCQSEVLAAIEAWL